MDFLTKSDLRRINDRILMQMMGSHLSSQHVVTGSTQIICHPSNYEYFRSKAFRANGAGAFEPSIKQGCVERVGVCLPCSHIPIITDVNVPQFEKEWVFPDERFWGYEDTDAAWCKPLGIGYERDSDRRVFFMLKGQPRYGTQGICTAGLTRYAASGYWWKRPTGNQSTTQDGGEK